MQEMFMFITGSSIVVVIALPSPPLDTTYCLATTHTCREYISCALMQRFSDITSHWPRHTRVGNTFLVHSCNGSQTSRVNKTKSLTRSCSSSTLSTASPHPWLWAGEESSESATRTCSNRTYHTSTHICLFVNQ